MDVYDFLNTFNDLDNVVVTIFDCDSERVVFNQKGETIYNVVEDIQEADLDAYDAESVDIFVEDGRIHMEINISMGEPEPEDDSEE